MTVKRFVGKNYTETLRTAKNALGSDAVILHTRSFKAGGVFGLWGRKVVEITASDEVAVRARRAGHAERPKLDRVLPKPYVRASVAGARHSRGDPGMGELAEEMHAVKEMVGKLISGARAGDCRDLPETLQKAYASLLDAGVPKAIAGRLARAVNSRLTADQSRDGAVVDQALHDELARRIEVCGPTLVSRGDRRVMALVGPTGVGKTTTIAELAAAYRFQNLQVGLVTLDFYRIAAVDQLRTYADILGVPIQVALTPGEFHDALEKFRNKDVVLVDTAGRSQRDRLKMNELRSFLESGLPDEVHLVASATTTRGGMKDVIENFGPLSSGRLILSKVDEAPGIGVVLDQLLDGGLKVSYLTTGQRVPEDIEPADASKLARLCLGVQNVNA